MILKASQRAGGTQLALHLLNDRDNNHVELHELRGFVADDLVVAQRQIRANLRQAQESRRITETKTRASRFPTGFKALWCRFTDSLWSSSAFQRTMQ